MVQELQKANCTGIGEAFFSIARQDLDAKGEINAQKTVLSKCKETMILDHVDLAGYTSKENAADFEDLRKALGYEQWNLFGVSYGSRLGLTIMRDFPKGIRSVVLGAIFAPENDHINKSLVNLENALFNVLERCKENEECRDRYPNLKERMLKSLEALQSNPLHFEYKGKPFVLNPQDALYQ